MVASGPFYALNTSGFGSLVAQGCRVAVAFSVFLAFLLPRASQGDEIAERFLEALRERGYYDVALDYLVELETSNLVTPEFKKVLPFERAQTLIKSAMRQFDAALVEKQLNEAQALLTKSAASADSPELQAKALRYQGNLLYGRATANTRQANNSRLTANEKEAIYKKSRDFLTQAVKVYTQAQTKLADYLRNYDIDQDDPQSASRLKQLQSVYTRIRIRNPQIAEQLADTYPENNANRKKYLERAAKEYAELWEKYFRFAAGRNSCLFAARCHFKLKDYDKAIAYLQEIFALGETAAFRGLKTQALVLAADCWQKMSPYPFDEVIANFEPFVERLTRSQLRDSAAQRIQLELAQAYQTKSEEIKSEGGKSSEINRYKRMAAKTAKTVARAPGKLRDRARELLAQWNLKIADDEPEAVTAIENFDDAKTKAGDIMADVEALMGELAGLKKDLRTIRNPNQKQEKESAIAKTRNQLEKAALDALEHFDLALKLADQAVPRVELNNIRYLQSFCHFAMERYFKSALIGEFLLERYPNMTSSRQAADIAVKSYSILYDQAAAEEREFERNRLKRVCTKVVDQWPGTGESNGSAAILSKLSLAANDIAAAKNYLDLIPESSSARRQIENSLGRKLWKTYKEKRKAKVASPDQISDQELKKLLADATQFLKNAVSRTKADSISYAAALAALYLVDAHLENGNVNAAIERLESAEVAPLDLVKQKHRAIISSGFAGQFVAETYKTAIKSYLAALRDQPDQPQWIDKAQGVMRAMRDSAEKSQSPKEKQRVIQIYQLIADELRDQFENIDSASDKRVFAENLSRFMSSIQQDTDDSGTILWVASTLSNVATVLSQTKDQEKLATKLFQQSIEAFDQAEKMGVADEQVKQELIRTRAIAKRGMGKFDEAVKDMVALLKSNPNVLRLQLDSADTLQMWGRTSKRSKPYAQAMMGMERVRDPKTKRVGNVVWGWKRIVESLVNQPKYSSAYTQAMFGLVEARLEYGIIEKNKKAIAAANKLLKRFKARDPKLGGPLWKTKFEALERRIQNQLTKS